ncbi:hypothetical protein PLICRDRAFT_110129, partial [Plicaturopsis crispa FD-325 SS-3]
IPYLPGLTPAPSLLRPHCLARERLQLWKPTLSRTLLDLQGQAVSLKESDLERIEKVIGHAWTENTRSTYGTGLLIFHVFCDTRGIPEEQRAPASSILMSSFVSALADSYAGKTIANYLHGVRAWHIFHGLQWRLNELEMEALLKAAQAVTPETSKMKKRLPYTIEYITSIRSQLDLDDPVDAAVFACLTTTFYATARVGEFTVQRLEAFDAKIHVKPSDVSVQRYWNSLSVTNFHLPRTKASQAEGEDVFWSRQDGVTDPKAAWLNHVRVNAPPASGHIFAYQWNGQHRPLIKSKFIKSLGKAARKAGLKPIQGHGIRIGSTLEYLLRGMPFEVMKAKGHWESDTFLVYLRNHACVMAPYLQAVPELHQQLVRITMPPVR